MEKLDKTIASPEPRRRMHADERKLEILKCAFAMIAEAGLENFRTREVADRAGINSATLHHYFPTKQALIESVASYLAGQYSEVHSAVAADPSVPAAVVALRREFADARSLRNERPDLLAVSAEFVLLARRDETAARLIASMHQHWRGEVEAIIRAGQSDGVFDDRIDPVVASMVFVGAIWSAHGLLQVSDKEFCQICEQLEAWLKGHASREGAQQDQ